MAVELEFASVIVRKSALERTHPGGIDGFVRRALPNFVEDDLLVRVAYMSTGEASELIEELAHAGIARHDMALVQGDAAPRPSPDVASTADFAGRFRRVEGNRSEPNDPGRR